MDEFKCLNLDITLPAMDQKAKSVAKCPVMIWIHGKLSPAFYDLTHADVVVA